MAARKTRSTLDFHQIPNFYSCYLLKSVRTTRSTATYIGSTPNPPRRIRQHNGEITAGAWKTKHGRPWIMQMIVYGFPSKLTALQFEWAWQHPNISRHLRDRDGKQLFTAKRSRPVKGHIQVARTMVSNPPYTAWPLHVKIFTEEAAKAWKTLDTDASTSPLPSGFTVQVELEGVDGKSGKAGSGRSGPLDVSDSVFTEGHLAKHEALLASGRRLRCVVCKEVLDDYQSDPLASALCTATGCWTTSHLACLSRHFLSSLPSNGNLLPRGGECPSCRNYILWGDVIRGCYRRQAGAAAESEADEDENSELEVVAASEGAIEAAALPPQASQLNTKGGGREAKKPGTKRARENKAVSKRSHRTLYTDALIRPSSAADNRMPDDGLISARGTDESYPALLPNQQGIRGNPLWRREFPVEPTSPDPSTTLKPRGSKSWGAILPSQHPAEPAPEVFHHSASSSGSDPDSDSSLRRRIPTRRPIASPNYPPAFRRRTVDSSIPLRPGIWIDRQDDNQLSRVAGPSDRSPGALARTPTKARSNRTMKIDAADDQAWDSDLLSYSLHATRAPKSSNVPSTSRDNQIYSAGEADFSDATSSVGALSDAFSTISLSSGVTSIARNLRADRRHKRAVIEISD